MNNQLLRGKQSQEEKKMYFYSKMVKVRMIENLETKINRQISQSIQVSKTMIALLSHYVNSDKY
jgi:hypothetical protein